ncbi:hypothetical protein DPEC_G00041220 [Dallia pectoralis]|uniref:Uncharacterized protein n=1 Tax=Dallia pectoralis TaxID=75939 RepID=A0ACC2HEU8_DALPE|nr:hypothetical protein DPEC_G00041220 [Dallia pectoralis]
METFYKFTASASGQLRQLQKMVQDIRKNDGSILNRLRRLKNKSAPKLPVRDYQGDDVDDEQWSENEFESDTYEDPQVDQCDNYEPPPSQKVFTPSSSVSFPRGDYVDSCRGRLDPPHRNPVRPPKSTKPSLPPKPTQRDDDDEDYVDPEDDNDDDYIEPTEKPNNQSHGRGIPVQSSPSMSRTKRSNSPDVYEVPDMEEQCPVPVSRPSTLKVPTQSLPPRASPRMHVKKSLPIPVQDNTEDEYEICNSDESNSTQSEEKPIPVGPRPMPRDMKPLKPSFTQKPDIVSRINEGPPLGGRQSTQKPLVTPQPPEFRRAKIILPPKIPSKKPDRGVVPSAENQVMEAEEGADVLKKPWYASTCDRKTAEEALTRSNKDGSFLIRKSSGQDTQQPYTLVVLYNSRVYNIPVRYIQGSQQYALGREKKGEERFASVSNIIENHQRNSLVLIDSQNNTKDSTKLCFAVQP